MSSTRTSTTFAEAVNASESNNDLPYQPGQLTTPHLQSSACTEYTTPLQNILPTSGTASDAVKTRLTESSPDGKKCSITLSAGAELLTTLEYAWGMKSGTLNLDTTQNMMWLSPNLHTWFDNGDWALLPPLSDLTVIQNTSLCQLSLAKKTKFTTVLCWGIRSYDFVHFTPATEPIFRFDRPGPINYSIYPPPFSAFPPVSSHIHPYFVICNIALKDKKHHPELSDEEQGQGYATLNQDQLDRVRLCWTIYDLWMGQSTAAAARASSIARSQSHRSSAHSTTSRRSNPERDAKRKRSDNQDHSGPADQGGSPRRRGGVPSSALGDSLRTPEEIVGEDGLALCINRFNPMEEPYWSKVRGWISDLASTECPRDSRPGIRIGRFEDTASGWVSHVDAEVG
ncbi:hypothetical protein RSAG8_12733, partial [Rhizoctonia solani AG-8 WAC10335]